MQTRPEFGEAFGLATMNLIILDPVAQARSEYPEIYWGLRDWMVGSMGKLDFVTFKSDAECGLACI